MAIKPVVAIFILTIPIMFTGCLGSDSLSEEDPCPYEDAVEHNHACIIVTDSEDIVGANSTDNLVVIEYQGCSRDHPTCHEGQGLKLANFKGFEINESRCVDHDDSDSRTRCTWNLNDEDDDSMWNIGEQIIISENRAAQSQLCSSSPCEVEVRWFGKDGPPAISGFTATIILE